TKTVTGTLAGPLTITATANALNPDTTTFSVATDSVAGGPDHLTFTSSTADLAAGATRTLTVQIRDAAGNVASGDNTTVVPVAKTTGTGTVTGLGTATAAGGVASKTVSGALAGSITIPASASALNSNA